MPTVNLKSLIQKLNPVCQRSLEAAAGLCLSRSHYNIEIEHWLLKLLEAADNDITIILAHHEIDLGNLIHDLNRSLENLKTGNAQSPLLSQRIIDLVREAWVLTTLEYNAEKIRSGYLLRALLQTENFQRIALSLSQQFAKLSADTVSVTLSNLATKSIETEIEKSVTTETIPKNIKTPALNQFTINLTEQAREGKIDQVIGRDTEIRQMIDILMRRRQNNPILTGEPGVGKTAVVEGFALRIANGEVPPTLQNVAVHSLDLGLLQAGAGVKGEFESRLKSVINEVKASAHPIILFIDEAHTLVGAGAQAGQGDAANLLKPALARGELRTIAATTWAEYKKYFEQDAALTRRFQVVKIEEPTEENAIQMLRGLIVNLEQHHQVRILDEALTAAVRLSHRYISGRQLPDKAISLLDTTCARLAIRDTSMSPLIEDYEQRITRIISEIALLQREEISGTNHSKQLKILLAKQNQYQIKLDVLRDRWQKENELIKEIRNVRQQLEMQAGEEILSLRKKLKKLLNQLALAQGELPLLQDCIDAQSIAEVVSAWTGIPLGRMVSDDIRATLSLEQRLHHRIIGQPYALQTIAQNIHTARAQLTDPRKPISVFLFVGPSGVGKTETALALAEQLYGGEQNLTVINLSEFKEEHKVSLLLGSPPGYVGYGEGGILTEAVRRKPYSLVLLDEIEKAHAGVQDIFYQVFDKGMLRDGQGRDIDFKNTVIILTSNVGSELMTRLHADPESMPDINGLIEILKPELLKVFKPAFLGRVTLVPYLPLGDDMMQKIIYLQLQRVEQRLSQHYQAKFTYTPLLVEHILERCREVDSGARNIDYVLSRALLPELSTQLLSSMANGNNIKKAHVDIDKSGSFICELV